MFFLLIFPADWMELCLVLDTELGRIDLNLVFEFRLLFRCVCPIGLSSSLTSTTLTSSDAGWLTWINYSPSFEYSEYPSPFEYPGHPPLPGLL